jgi:hypothetical protein
VLVGKLEVRVFEHRGFWGSGLPKLLKKARFCAKHTIVPPVRGVDRQAITAGWGRDRFHNAHHSVISARRIDGI